MPHQFSLIYDDIKPFRPYLTAREAGDGVAHTIRVLLASDAADHDDELSIAKTQMLARASDGTLQAVAHRALAITRQQLTREQYREIFQKNAWQALTDTYSLARLVFYSDTDSGDRDQDLRDTIAMQCQGENLTPETLAWLMLTITARNRLLVSHKPMGVNELWVPEYTDISRPGMTRDDFMKRFTWQDTDYIFIATNHIEHQYRIYEITRTPFSELGSQEGNQP